MENFQSTIEGEWVKVNSIILTATEKALLASTSEENIEAKSILLEEIKSKKYTNVTEPFSSILIGLYNRVKPVVKETDTYQLIACDILKTKKLSGILNCRINGEHKQVRF